MLTPEQLLEKTAALNYIDELYIREGRLHFLHRFSVFEDQEQHDAAWDCRCDIQDELREIGLQAVEVENDNDSVWGVIVEAREGLEGEETRT